MKLSIIISSCYQAAHIQSMLWHLRDTERKDDFNIIVIDDTHGSDEALPALRKFLGDNFTNRSIVASGALGTCKLYAGGCRNLGVISSTADWVWFVDGDDSIPPGAIERILTRLDSTRANCLVLDYEIVRKDGARTSVRFSDRTSHAERLELWQVGIMAWHKVIRRSVFFPFREEMAEDGDWWPRQCLEIMRYSNALTPLYDTVPLGSCYTYIDHGPGAFTTALDRFMDAPNPAAAAEAAFADRDTAVALAAQLRQLAECAEIINELRNANAPKSFIDNHKFVIRWWLNKIAKLGGVK